MAKKKRGFGKILGAITGSPYDRLLKQIGKNTKEHDGDDRTLARVLKKHSRTVQKQYEEGNIDDASLANEMLSLLEKQKQEINEIDSKSQNYVYEMYNPFIRGHWSDNGIDIPKTKLLRWMQKV